MPPIQGGCTLRKSIVCKLVKLGNIFIKEKDFRFQNVAPFPWDFTAKNNYNEFVRLILRI